MTELDVQNADFWDELCGSPLARLLGVIDASPDSLRRFDEAYLAYYPYLAGYLEPVVARHGRTLEIGLGYGTVGAYLARGGVDYHGLDIAKRPVDMLRGRLTQLGHPERVGHVVQGSALAIPWPDAHFDAVVSIGCLHHAGDLAAAVREVHRVLVPGGLGMVMVYNRNSLRQLLSARPRAVVGRMRGLPDDQAPPAGYDAKADGEPAPFTEFTSARRAAALFGQFDSVTVVRENMAPLPRLRISREKLLGWPARLFGLDLYVTAVK